MSASQADRPPGKPRKTPMPRASTEPNLLPARRAPADERERRNRADLRAQVRQYWVEGALRNGLYAELRRELGLPERPDLAVAPPGAVVLPAGAAPRPLAPGETICDLFAATGRLLILGASGSGRTTAMLALAESLLDAADADEALPIPAVFPLASWAARRQPLRSWLVEELARSYKVPAPLGAAWVAAGVILPLLDGLDEVGQSDDERAGCLAAIDAYLSRCGGPAVLCADTGVVGARTRHFPLAMALQPLAPGAAAAEIARLGPELSGLAAALARDAALRDLAASPLLLAVMVGAYVGQPTVAAGRADPAQLERRLWADFVARRLALPAAAASADPEQLRAWLIWLARGMEAHHQQLFQIEYLQPGWLATPRQRRLASWLGTLGVTLLLCALGALLSGLLGGMFGSLAAALLLLLVGVLGGARVAGLLFRRPGAPLWEHPGVGLRRLYYRSRIGTALRATLTALLVAGLAVSALVALLRVVGAGVFADVAERLMAEPGALLNLALVVVLLTVLNGVGGVVRQESEILVRTEPDNGDAAARWAMVWGGLRRGLLFGLLLGVMFGVRAGLETGLRAGMIVAVVGAIVGAFLSRLIFGLSFGGSALVQHIVLRWLLHRRCGVPWDITAALDDAVSRGLLTRVGGGYRFPHRRLQAHFARHARSSLPIAPILGPPAPGRPRRRRGRQGGRPL